MALQGLPGMTDAAVAFVQSVRGYIRDFPELNRLVAGEESTDRQIAWALLDALYDFNGTPPITQYDLDFLLSQNQHALLLRMTVITLIESIALLQTRNHVNYSDGGVNLGVNDKTPLLMNFLQYYKGTTEQMKLRVKTAMNIMTILGPGNYGVPSELSAVNATYAAY